MQRKVSKPIFDFVHFVNDIVPEAKDYSEGKAEDKLTVTELKSAKSWSPKETLSKKLL